jgi:type II secretory pathway pseudopilin PulG
MMKNTDVKNVSNGKYTGKSCRTGILSGQKGFNLIEFLIFLAFIGLMALIVIPNLNLFLGVDKKLTAANLEAANMRVAAQAYETNTGKYPANSSVLWSDPAGPADYVGKPRAYYTFDVGNGRIISAATGNEQNAPADSWTGIMWDYESGSWVKQ